jgi:phage/plasmid-like protein (TIGR03299 family)
MAHEIWQDRIAWTNEAPWHGLGIKVDENITIEEMMRLSRTAWTVSRRPLYRMPGYTEAMALADEALHATGHVNHDPLAIAGNGRGLVRVKDAAEICRDDDGTPLDIVGSQYNPIQNAEGFEFFRRFLDEGHAKLNVMGALRGGKYVWGLAKLNTDFEVTRGDKVEGFVLVLIPHVQGKSLMLCTTSTRVVCMNTLRGALGWDGVSAIKETESTYSVAHNSVWDESRMADARETLGLARETIGGMEVFAKKLVSIRMTDNDAVDLLAPIYQPKHEPEVIKADFAKNANRPLQTILQAVHKAPGATPGNAWGVLNGVTYFHDHLSGRSADVRLTSSWTGEGAQKKSRVVKGLLELAA